MIATVALIMIALLADPVAALEVDPPRATLVGSDSLTQLAVTAKLPDGSPADHTSVASFRSRDPRVALVDADGLVRPAGDGVTTVEIRDREQVATVEVTVSDFANARPVHFVGEVLPILTRYGCNAGGCHGKSGGQNGFRLSLLGFDPRADYESLVIEGRGRRVFPPAPSASLLVRKPTAQVPHGGGKKFAVGSPEYNTLCRWVGQGMPFGAGQEPALARLSVVPEKRVVARGGRLQLRTVAHYADGRSVDVTRLAQYQSNAGDLAEVDSRGVVQALNGVGEAAVMARFGGQVAVARAVIPTGRGMSSGEEPATGNPIDALVARKLRELGLEPSAPCSDAEFARRSSLDLNGVLPSPAEVQAFEADRELAKRTRWVEGRLDRPEYADYFALKWSAILRNKRTFGDLSKASTFGFHEWIRTAIAENRPYDQFVAAIVSARGEASTNPPVVWYRQVNTLEERVDDTAQLFLGQRIQCARCHHHPFEKWSQDDYYGFASLFTRIGVKAAGQAQEFRIFTRGDGLATNPLTGEARAPRPLGGPDLTGLGPHGDPRVALADWLRRPENPFFARALVNRYWKHFLGRGLVEPEDDMRASNPPSDPDLLDALAADFIASGFDLRRLCRTIATSQAYGRSSAIEDGNRDDRRNFARFYPRRLPAEVLLDAIDAVTDAPEKFTGLPPRTRATQLPDDGFRSDFLDVFGRPKRESVCECERTAEANLAQSLQLLNSSPIQDKLTRKEGRAARLADDPRDDLAKVDELYRIALSRPPTEPERRDCLAYLDVKTRASQKARGYEDLIWALINTKEFLFNH